ncbi:hypothetical protein Tco_1011044 [Tanacetum coccineum]|uniref:Reverse transcriptase domain-containing protein n=1 Tax=Tanacetum coccineum TaxID=301880 RepID=A0ABQ4ZAE8_9ASTR
MQNYSKLPTEGYGDAIVTPVILAENFELKHGLLNLVTSKQFYGFKKEDPHAHIVGFNKDYFLGLKYLRCARSVDEAYAFTIFYLRGSLRFGS